MKVHLQPWYDQWLKEAREAAGVGPDDPNGPSLYQVHFVRDDLSSIMWADVPYDKRPQCGPPREDCKENGFVVGEHTSNSKRLPVYSLERPDLGIQFVMRDNYHDWNISVLSERAIETDLRGFQLDYSREEDKQRFKNGYRPGNSWGYCYFQGFPEEFQFGPYSEDQRKFSLCVGSVHKVWTLIFLIMRDIRGIGPWKR